MQKMFILDIATLFTIVTSIFSADTYLDVKLEGYYKEVVNTQLGTFANDKYGQPFIYNTTSNEVVEIWYGAIKETYSRNQTLQDCYPVQFKYDYQSNIVCLFKPNIGSSENDQFMLRRYNGNIGGVISTYPNGAEIKLPDLTNTTDYVSDWHVVYSVTDWLYLISTLVQLVGTTNITTVKYYTVQLDTQAMVPYSNYSNLAGFTVVGNFEIKPHFKAVTGIKDTLIIFNTLNTTLPFSTANQQSNTHVLVLSTRPDKKWSGKIIELLLTEGSGNSNVALLFDIAGMDSRIFVLFPRISSTDPAKKLVASSSFVVESSFTGDILQGVTIKTVSTDLYPLYQNEELFDLETNLPSTFAHYAQMRKIGQTTDSLMLFLHLPRTTARPKDSRTQLYWVDHNDKGKPTVVGDRVVAKPTDSIYDIRVKQSSSGSGNFNILYLDENTPAYIDFYTPNSARYAADDKKKKIGEVFLYRVGLHDCWSAHLAILNPNDFDNLKDPNFKWPLFCNHNGMASWFSPADDTYTYSLVMNMSKEPVKSSITLNATNLTDIATNDKFDLASKRLNYQAFSSPYDVLSAQISTNFLKSRKNSYQVLPLYFTEIRGANVSIRPVDDNAEVDYMDYRKHELVFSKTIGSFDLDEIFPISYGAVASMDNKAIALFQCSELADFSTQKVNMQCTMTSKIDLPFIKIITVKDYYSKCSQILILALNNSVDNKLNETLIITYNGLHQRFDLYGNLSNRTNYDVGCTKSGQEQSVFAAGWNYSSASTVISKLWINGILSNDTSKTAKINDIQYINSGQFSNNETKAEFFYFTYYKINELGVLSRLPFDLDKGFGNATNSTRHLPLGNRSLLYTCIFKTHYLTYLRPLKNDSWIFVYSMEMTPPIKDYYSIIKYKFTQLNLTSVIDIYCHQLSDVEAFTIYAKQTKYGKTYSLFLTFVISAQVDQRLYSIINRTEAITSVSVTDNLSDRVFITMRQYQLASVTWRIKFGGSQLIAHYKNVKTEKMPFTMVFKYEAYNEQRSVPFNFTVTFEDTASIEVIPQQGLTYVKGKTWKLVPDLLKSLDGPVRSMAIQGEGAKITRSRILKLNDVVTIKLPIRNEKIVTPTIFGDFDSNVEVIYVDFDNVFYVYFNKKMIAQCSANSNQINVKEIVILKIVLDNISRLWILYAGTDGTIYSLQVTLPTGTKTAGTCGSMISILSGGSTDSKIKLDSPKDLITVAPYTGTNNLEVAFGFSLWSTSVLTKSLKTYFCRPPKQNLTPGTTTIMECPLLDKSQNRVSIKSKTDLFQPSKLMQQCARAMNLNHSLVYHVCLGVDVEGGPFTEIIVISYFSTPDSIYEIAVSYQTLDASLLGDTKYYIYCSLGTNSVISCVIGDKLGNKITQLILKKNATCPVEQMYCFTVDHNMDYMSPENMILQSYDVSPNYIVAVYYRMQGPNRLDETDFVVFKVKSNYSYYSTPGGKYNDLAKYSMQAGFFGMNTIVAYIFDSRNMVMQLFELGEAEIIFDYDIPNNMTGIINFEPQGNNPVVNLTSLFKIDPNAFKKSEVVQPTRPEQSILVKYWYIIAIGGVVLAATLSGVTYYCIRRENLRRKQRESNDFVINKLEDFIF